jgi:hypothetical protein
MSDFIEWSALAQVLVAGVLVGAGIPALFALGLRLLAGTAPNQEDAVPAVDQTSQDGARQAPGAMTIARPGPARLVGAVLCLAVVVAAVVTGLIVVVSGGH